MRRLNSQSLLLVDHVDGGVILLGPGAHAAVAVALGHLGAQTVVLLVPDTRELTTEQILLIIGFLL